MAELYPQYLVRRSVHVCMCVSVFQLQTSVYISKQLNGRSEVILSEGTSYPRFYTVIKGHSGISKKTILGTPFRKFIPNFEL